MKTSTIIVPLIGHLLYQDNIGLVTLTELSVEDRYYCSIADVLLCQDNIGLDSELSVDG